MKKRFRDYIIGDVDLFLLGMVGLFAAAFLIDSREYNPTAAMLPRLVAVITLLLVVGSLIQHYVKVHRQDRTLPQEGVEDSEGKRGGLVWYLNLSAILLYFLMIFVIGLIGASLLYLLLAPLILGYRRFKIVAVIAGCWIVFFVYVFTQILYTRLPAGVLGNLITELISK